MAEDERGRLPIGLGADPIHEHDRHGVDGCVLFRHMTSNIGLCIQKNIELLSILRMEAICALKHLRCKEAKDMEDLMKRNAEGDLCKPTDFREGLEQPGHYAIGLVLE